MNASLLRLMPLLVFGITVANAQQLTTTEDVNLRRGPSTRSVVITTLDAGTEVTLLRKRSGYDRVQTSDGTIGWIYGRFLTDATTAPVAPAPSPDIVPPTTRVIPPVAVVAGVYHACDAMGNVSPNAPHVQELQQLNTLKNRATNPAEADIDSTFTMANLLQRGADDTRFDATKGGIIEGIVVDAKVGGIETGNCKAKEALYRDTHIEVALRSPAAATKRVIVEVTPRWRDAMSKVGLDWTTHGLKALCGHQVRFRGWVMFDAEHSRRRRTRR